MAQQYGEFMSEPRRRSPVALAFALGLLVAPSALLAETSSAQLMKARHDHYHQLGDAFKTIRDQARDSSPDLKAIQSAAKVVNEASIDQQRWFSAGTGPEAGKTRALAEIWSRPQDFAAAQKMFSDAAPKLLAAANASDVAGIKTQFGAVGKTCKNCHDTFRSKEEHE
jgi:cytochrome c556